MNEIYITKSSSIQGRQLIIEGDKHSVWAYYLQIDDGKSEVLLDGFLCSCGQVVDDSSEVKNLIQKNYQPPLMAEYANEFSIQNNISNDDIQIQWSGDLIIIFVKGVEYLIMDCLNMKSFSKAISNDGPYGKPIELFEKT